MFQVRSRKPKNLTSPSKSGPKVEVTTSGENVPKIFSPAQNWRERWCTMPASFSNRYEEIYNFEVKQDDVFVVTFPKSGTTWVQEAIWLLLNDLNYEVALSVDQSVRSVYMEMSRLNPKVPHDTVEQSRKLKSPRVIKTHLPAHLLPRQIWKRKTKIVYCARNVKDVVVSFFKFTRGLGFCTDSMDDFVSEFINSDIMYTPYWNSLLDYWQLREESNVFFTTYEQLHADLPAVLRALCEFLERPALTEAEMAKLVEHLSFDNMKANACTNPTLSVKKALKDSSDKLPEFDYMRRGIVGAYKDELSIENQKRLDDWTQKCLDEIHMQANDIFGDC